MCCKLDLVFQTSGPAFPRTVPSSESVTKEVDFPLPSQFVQDYIGVLDMVQVHVARDVGAFLTHPRKNAKDCMSATKVLNRHETVEQVVPGRSDHVLALLRLFVLACGLYLDAYPWWDVRLVRLHGHVSQKVFQCGGDA
eukprot:988167-Amphidinium_carterae.1